MASEEVKSVAEQMGFPPEVLKMAVRYSCLHIDVTGSTTQSERENTSAGLARNAWIDFASGISERYGGRRFDREGDGVYFLFWKSTDDPFKLGTELSSIDACIRAGIDCLTGLLVFNTQYNESSYPIKTRTVIDQFVCKLEPDLGASFDYEANHGLKFIKGVAGGEHSIIISDKALRDSSRKLMILFFGFSLDESKTAYQLKHEYLKGGRISAISFLESIKSIRIENAQGDATFAERRKIQNDSPEMDLSGMPWRMSAFEHSQGKIRKDCKFGGKISFGGGEKRKIKLNIIEDTTRRKDLIVEFGEPLPPFGSEDQTYVDVDLTYEFKKVLNPKKDEYRIAIHNHCHINKTTIVWPSRFDFSSLKFKYFWVDTTFNRIDLPKTNRLKVIQADKKIELTIPEPLVGYVYGVEWCQ